MERLIPEKYSKALLVAALSVAVLKACSTDNYSTDSSNVRCDGTRTMTDFNRNGMAAFIVHGEDDSLAIIQVRQNEEGISVKVSGDITGPPQQLKDDGFTPPAPVVDGAELSTFGANGLWIIDADKNSVVIQGSCDGM